MTVGSRPHNRYLLGNAQKKLGGGSFRCRSSSGILGGETQCPKLMPREVSAKHTVTGNTTYNAVD